MPITPTKKKKDGLTQYRVRINYTDQFGKPCQIERTAYGRDEARELELRLLHEYKNNKASARSMTLNELYDEYISTRQHEVREVTLSKSVTRLKSFVLPSLGDYKLDKLSVPVLQKWKDNISAYRSDDGQGYSLNYKRSIYKELRSLINYAVRMDYIQKSPLQKIGNFKDSAALPQQNIRFYTSDEFKSFISVAKNICEQRARSSIYEWNYYIFFMIAFYTGARKGEINALTWNDIDFNKNVIHITKSVAQKLKGEDRITQPKNKSSYRDVSIPQILTDTLSEHMRRYQSIGNFNKTWYVCGGEHCIRDTTLEKRNTEYAAAAELKHIRIHDFRHTHASVLINNGINIMAISKRLGHTNVEITWNTYSHLYPEEENKVIKALENI